MQKIILHHHLGLGDHFICNGIVNVISKASQVYLICKNHYATTINSLYSDNFNVKIIPINGTDNEVDQVEGIQREYALPLLKIGFQNIDHTKFDQNFYECVGLPFEYRYSKFTLPKFNIGSQSLFKKLAHHKEYILIHNQSSEGVYDIKLNSSLPTIYVDPTQTNNMMDWYDLIKNASQIHCIPSSFYCLVDSISSQLGATLFYHNIRKGTLLNPNNKFNNSKWNVIDYDIKL